jgi:hypothetical protein
MSHPDPAKRPVRQCALWRHQLDDAEHKGRHRGKGMQGYLGRRIEQWRQTHGKAPRMIDIPR